MERSQMTAHDVRSTGVITVAPDSSVEDVARTLLTGRISAVPVVDDDGRSAIGLFNPEFSVGETDVFDVS